jgi:mono/diheme cytochrome c family protein
MSPAAHGLDALSTADQDALVTYVASLRGADVRPQAAATAMSRALGVNATNAGRQIDPDARFYVAACASCHYNSSVGINPSRPDLALNSAVHLADPANLIRVILFGIDAPEGASGLVMPAFGSGFTDAEVAQIAAYLRRTRTNEPPWPHLEKTVGGIRAQGKGEG